MFTIGHITLSFFLGILVSAIISHFLAKDRDKQIQGFIAFNNAATEFRNVFNEIILNIDHGENLTTAWLLGQYFMTHKDAMLTFRPYLTGKSIKQFDEVWRNYEQFYKDNYHEESTYERITSPKTQHEVEKREELKQHINNLLEFTKI